MDVITVNVGQGSLSIVRNNNEAIIIDSRIPPVGDKTVTYVKSIFSQFLKDHNVKGLILTGFDNDHSDAIGVQLVLNKYRPDWIMYPQYYKDTGAASDVFKVIKTFEKNCNKDFNKISVSLDKGNNFNCGKVSDQFSFKFFSPQTNHMTNSNNSSIVMQIKGVGTNGFTYLITGDTENSRWTTINNSFGDLLKSDVLAVPHHGSINATNSQTMTYVNPHTALISAGVGNQYGHPSSKVVQAYGKISKVYCTNLPEHASLLTTKINGELKTLRFDI